MGAEAAIFTASAFEEPATAVGRWTLRAGDQASRFFGEALVDGVEESGRSIAQDDSAVFFHRNQLESRRRKFFGQLRQREVAKGADRFPPQIERIRPANPGQSRAAAQRAGVR